MTTQKLTDTQLRALSEVSDTWLAHGLAVGPADREEAEAGVADAYRAAGLEPPTVFVWLDSPLAGALGAWMLAGTKEQGEEQTGGRGREWDQSWERVRAGIRAGNRPEVWTRLESGYWRQLRVRVGSWAPDSVEDPTWARVWDQLRAQVHAQGGAGLVAGEPVRDRVWVEARKQVDAHLSERVEQPVWGQFHAQVAASACRPTWFRDVIRHHVRDSDLWGRGSARIGGRLQVRVRDSALRSAPGQHHAEWFVPYDFFRTHCSITEVDRVAGVMRVARSAGRWWPFQNAVILTERPTVLHHDDRSAPHRATGPAVAYPDGSALWAWHGTSVPRDLIETGWSSERTLTEPDPELRRCAIEKSGWDRFVREAGLTTVAPGPDTPEAPRHLALYDLPGKLAGLFAEPTRLLLRSYGSDDPYSPRPGCYPVPAHHTDPAKAAREVISLPSENPWEP